MSGATSQGSAESTHPSDLLAAYALDALEPEEAEGVGQHVSGCPRCAGEVGDLRAVVESLAFDHDPAEPPARVKHALMSRVHLDLAGGENAAQAPAPSAGTEVARPEAVRSPQGWGARLRSLVAAPAGRWALGSSLVALVLLVTAALLAWQSLGVRSELDALRRDYAEVASRLSEEGRAISGLDPQRARVVDLPGTESAPGADGRVIYDPQSQVALLRVGGLIPPAEGRVYQVWLIADNVRTNAGTVAVGGDGDGSLVIEAPRSLGSFDGIGITVEPAPGSPQPTGPRVLGGQL